MEEGKKKRNSLNASFVTGAIALVFLIIGYQVALFVHKAAVTRIAANRDRPDTVYVYASPEEIPPLPPVGRNDRERPVGRNDRERPVGRGPSVISSGAEGGVEKSPRLERHNASHSAAVQEVRAKLPRRVESFRFNPNTVSIEDLQRLGFSERQAQSIENYRLKGGRFRRPADFAKSYVVADSIYARLEPYIDIPRLDINQADSVALLDLPGIGPYFAGKIVQYRTQLGGYSSPEQLMEIYHFDEEKYAALQDLITCSEPEGYALWALHEADLAKHPHISRSEAHGIVLFRAHHAPAECTVEALRQAGVLSPDHAAALSRCRIVPAK